MNAINMFRQCAACDVCKGAGYQVAPLLYAGNESAKIVAVAQNPGEMSDTKQIAFMNAITSMVGDPEMDEATLCRALYNVYHIDFTMSSMYATMTKAFGDGWLLDVTYTNAVRCRTPKNEKPSDEMMWACQVWSRKLIERPNVKGVILLGAFARAQLFPGMEDKLGFFTLRRNGPTGRLVLTLPHPAIWKSSDLNNIKNLYTHMKEVINGA